MDMIQLEYDDGVALVKLNRPVTNALNLQMTDEMAKALQNLEHDSSVRSVVFCSSSAKFFSIGFDIPHLFELTRRDFGVFYHAFNRVCLHLYTLPKPTVAAITGHAIAGGCILALCCDYRFIADGRKLMGLNEIKLGVPVPYLADCVLRHLVGTRYAREVVETGEFYPPEESSRLGMVDLVLPLEEVMPRAIEKARSLGASSQEAYTMIKQNRVETVKAQILARFEDKAEYFVERWYSVQAREQLLEAMKKF
jgi:enoyl-CoA hydratase/carnithine racemase